MALAALCVLGGGIGTLTSDFSAARAGLARGVDAIQRLLDRSPGERTRVGSVKDRVEPAKTARRVIPPRDRVLGKIFTVPPGQNPLVDPPLVAMLDSPVLEPMVGEVSNPANAPTLLRPVPTSTIGLPSSSSSGGLPPGGSSGGNPPPPPIPAVPEPQTWLLMIAGFAVVGRALRRRSKLGVQIA